MMLINRIVNRLPWEFNVSRDIGYSTIAFIANAITNTILVLVLGRLYSVSHFGELLFASSLGTITGLLPAYGFDVYIVREISQKRLEKHSAFVNINFAKLLLTLITIAGVGLYVVSVTIPTNPTLAWLFVISGFFSTFISFNGAMRKSELDFRLDASTACLRCVGLSILTILSYLFFPGQTLPIGISTLFVTFCVWAFSFSFVVSRIGVKAKSWLNPDFSLISATIKEAFPFGLQVILSTVYFQIDTLFLGSMKGAEEVAYYQAASRLIVAIMPFANLFINTFYPRIAANFDAATGKINKNFHKQLMGFLLLMGLAGTLAFLFPARLWIDLLYGSNNQLGKSIGIMQILSFVLAIRFVAGGLGILLIAVRKQHLLVWAAGIATILNISLNLWLIPGYGGVGSAIANVLSNLFILGFYTWCIFFKTRVVR